MFEIPDTKPIRRDELDDDSPSSTDIGDEARLPRKRRPLSDTNEVNMHEEEKRIREKLNAQLAGLLQFDIPGPPPRVPLKPANREHDDDDSQREAEQSPQKAGDLGNKKEDVSQELTFTFRLFRDDGPAPTVILDKPRNGNDEDAGSEGGFVVPRRPRAYYVAEEPDPKALARFRHAAVTAQFLKQDVGRQRWGIEKPWRVISVTISPGSGKSMGINVQSCTGNDHQTSSRKQKRRRPGKKRRIRNREERKRTEVVQQQSVEKEERLKEKKKRLNREKKLKRRAKEKEKKGSGAVDMPVNEAATNLIENSTSRPDHGH